MHPALRLLVAPLKGVGDPTLLWDLDFTAQAYLYNRQRYASVTDLPLTTFTRASTGYGATAAGALTSFASGVPRITDAGLTVEAAATNLLLRSQEFDNAAWTKAGGTIAANAAVAPDGSTTADALIEGTGTVGPTVYQAVTVANATPYTGSCFVKRGAGSRNFSLRMEAPTAKIAVFDFDAVSVVSVTAGATATITALAGGWFRVSITTTSTSAGTAYLQPQMISGTTYATYTGDGVSSFYLWGAQLEAGSFTSSDIPTTTAAATRAADQITVSSVAVPLTNFTLCAEVALDSLAGGGYQGAAALDDGTSANQVYVFKTAGNSRARGGVDIASATVFDTASSPSTLPVLAVGVSKLSFIRAGGSVRVEANGILYPDTTHAALPALSRLNVGRFNGNSFPTNGYVRRITLMDRAVGGLTA